MGGDLISVCLDVIQRKNVRDLQLDKKDVNFRILERHLKDLLINVKTTGARTKVIRGLVPFVGRYEFHKDGQTTTIKVRITITPIDQIDIPIDTKLFHRNIIKQPTTSLYSTPRFSESCCLAARPPGPSSCRQSSAPYSMDNSTRKGSQTN